MTLTARAYAWCGRVCVCMCAGVCVAKFLSTYTPAGPNPNPTHKHTRARVRTSTASRAIKHTNKIQRTKKNGTHRNGARALALQELSHAAQATIIPMVAPKYGECARAYVCAF